MNYKDYIQFGKTNTIDELKEENIKNLSPEDLRIAFSAFAVGFLDKNLAKKAEDKEITKILKMFRKDIKKYATRVKLVAEGKTPDLKEYSLRTSADLINALNQMMYLNAISKAQFDEEEAYNYYILMNIVEDLYNNGRILTEIREMKQEWADPSL